MGESILGNWLQINKQSVRDTSTRPPIEDWMRASRNDVARVVERVNLTLLIPSDGSRRHFLLRQLQQKNRSSETIEYLSAQGAQLMGLFRLLF